MSNLPIPPNTSLAATQAAPNAQPAQDNAQSAQPFGEVLARQVADAHPEKNAQPKKITPKTAEELFAEIKTKADGALPPASNPAAPLATDMLATLLPQNPLNIVKMSAPNVSSAATPPTTSAVLPQTVLAKTEAGNAMSTPAAAPVRTEAKQDAAFTAMLDKMTQATTSTLTASDEKALTLAAPPQPAAPAIATPLAPPTLLPSTVLPAQLTINTPVTQDNWGEEFNQKITWLASSKEQTAELHLNPPQLGPMDVVLKVSGDQATALFTSPHAAVRDAIEQALPKLREMMADNGIMLGNATVSDQASRNSQDQSNSSAQRSHPDNIAGISDSARSNMSVRVSPISRHNGIVDTFA